MKTVKCNRLFVNYQYPYISSHRAIVEYWLLSKRLFMSSCGLIRVVVDDKVSCSRFVSFLPAYGEAKKK